LAYLFHALAGAFAGSTGDSIGVLFEELLASPRIMLGWHALFMLLTVVVVGRGINKGIERAITLLMPAMFVLLLILVAYAFTTRGFGKSVSFLFSPDFTHLTTTGVLTALGHAFFTLSLGMSNMIAYGSHLPKHISIIGAAVTVSLLDTIVALLAGLAIFAVVFSNGLIPGAGPGLVFQTLPLAFGHITGGYLIGIFFFFMLVFAAWSSSISLTEPVVEGLESRFGIRRPLATTLVGISAWSIGILSVLSFNVLQDYKPIMDKTLFDCLDYLTANIMLPLTGLMVAIFCGWVMNRNASLEELETSEGVHGQWVLLLRYVTPVLVVVVFLYNLF